MITAKDVLVQVSAARMQCEAMAINLRVLEGSIKDALVAERAPVGPVKPDPATQVDCPCPPNARVVISKPGQPGRTKCTRCEKEHEG